MYDDHFVLSRNVAKSACMADEIFQSRQLRTTWYVWTLSKVYNSLFLSYFITLNSPFSKFTSCMLASVSFKLEACLCKQCKITLQGCSFKYGGTISL